MQIGFKQTPSMCSSPTWPWLITKPKIKNKIFDRHRFSHSMDPVTQKKKTNSRYVNEEQELYRDEFRAANWTKYKIIGIKLVWGILLPTSSELQDPKTDKCVVSLSNFTASWGKKSCGGGKKTEISCFAQLPSTMSPVECYSEKINICWKVQTDDKEPCFRYCIWCVRHGQTWHMRRTR